MAAYYFDTSALVKRYKTETGTPVVEELLDDLRAGESLITSWLTVVELEATMARARRGNLFDDRSYGVAMARLWGDIGYKPFTLQEVSTGGYLDAINLTRRYALRGADAIQLATATQVRDAFAGTDNVIFVCSDNQLHQAAAAERLEILDPKLPDALEYLRKLRPSNPLPNL